MAGQKSRPGTRSSATPRSSVAELVARFEQLGSQRAYVFRRGYRTIAWTYRDLARTARQFAGELAARNIGRGDHVLLWGENCAEWVAAFFGCALAGAVAVPIDRASAPEFAARVASQVKARLVVCSRSLLGNIPGVDAIALEDLAAAIGHHSSQLVAAPAARDDVLQVIFTSGTTAEPRGVVITHGNVLANLEPLEREIARYLKYEWLVHPLRFLDLLPLSHVFGQFLGVFVPQALGATVVFQDSLNPAEVIANIRRQRVSVCITVPRMLESLKQQIEREYEGRGESARLSRDLASAEGKHFVRNWWRFRRIHRAFGWKFWAFVSGGAALDEATETFWRRTGFAVIQGYGLTETTSLISVNHPFRTGRRSIGKLLPGREVKLGPDGEILVRGENIASRYWQGGQLTEVAGDEGWFHTGDLGEFDGNGNLYFKGRKKNVIVTPAGMNVHPADLEEALRRQPEIRDCVVVGVPVGGNAEPCAILLMNDGANPDQAVARANEQLAEYQRIRRWLLWPEPDFPRTPTQKPKVGVLEQFALSQGQSTAADAGIGDLLKRITSRDVGHVGADAELDRDFQLTSIDRVELMAALEDRYQVDLHEVQFQSASKVSDLQRIVRESEQAGTRHQYPDWPQRWPFTWIRPLVYATLAWPATMLLAKPKVIGRENLRDIRGPVLIVCNHVTFVDIGFVLAALPWRMRRKVAPAMLGELLAAMKNPPAHLPWWRRALDRLEHTLILALFNVFPLPQRSGFLKAFEHAGRSADRGYSVLVFPEGRRTDTGEIDRFQSGVGILAQRLNLPVVPMRIHGLFEAAKRDRRFVPPNSISVRVGTPVKYRPEDDAASITKDLERRVREL